MKLRNFVCHLMSAVLESGESSAVPQLLLTLQQAADSLAISRRTLEREIQRGRFPPPLKIGGAARVERASVLRYVESLKGGFAQS